MFEERPDGTDRIVGPNQKRKCPKCSSMYHFGHEILTITKSLIKHKDGSSIGDKPQIIDRKSKVRVVCEKCGYKGVWRYANLYTNQNNKVDE